MTELTTDQKLDKLITILEAQIEAQAANTDTCYIPENDTPVTNRQCKERMLPRQRNSKTHYATFGATIATVLLIVFEILRSVH